jgi:streptogramin lyase
MDSFHNGWRVRSHRVPRATAARRAFGLVVACIAFFLVSAASNGAETAGEITEFGGISEPSYPAGIAAGAEGDLWFAEAYNRIGRITPEGAVTEFSQGISSRAETHDIALGPDGNLWFTEAGAGRIGRITPQGAVTEFSEGISKEAEPYDITAGPDGNLWFTDINGSRIGRITPQGVVTEFSKGITAESGPEGIAAGPDGNVWFTESYGSKNRIGRITPTGEVTEFSQGLSGSAQPTGITAGPDGNIWFTEPVTDKIGRITPQGVITEFSAGTSGDSVPWAITSGPDGNLWFTERQIGRIGRITPTGEVTEFSGIAGNRWPTGIAVGAEGNLWFTEVNGGARIGRIIAKTAYVTTEAASDVSTSTAVLRGSYVTARERQPKCEFEFGFGTSYESKVPCSPSTQDGGEGLTAVEAQVSGLRGNTLYHFRLTVEDTSREFGPDYGKDVKFTTSQSQAEREKEEAERREREKQERERAEEREREEREQRVEQIEEEQEEASEERLDAEGYGKFAIESYGPVSGTLDVRNPPGTHLEGLTGEEIEEAGLPPGAVAVVGGVSYSLQGLPPGTSVNAKFFLPKGSNPTNVYKKVNGQWVDETSLATISGNEITFHVRDGGPGDEDGVANGVIVDPMVPVRLENPAARPEVGRCAKAPTAKEGRATIYLGDYFDSKCSKSVPDTGKYKWKPGFDKGAFALSGTKSTFETANKMKISCVALSGAGEYTGATGESVRITLSGCTSSSKVKCESSGDPEGQIVSSLLGGPIAYAEAGKGTSGIDLAPIAAAEPDFADFQCAGTQERVTGSVIGQVKTVDKPSTAIEVQFKAKKGVQSLQSLEGAPTDTLSLLSGSAAPEAVGLTSKVKQKGEEVLEVKG